MCKAILILAATLSAVPAQGQSRPDATRSKGPPQFVAVGIGMAPKYTGASDYKIIPFGGARVRVPGGDLLVQGPGLTYSYRVSDAIELGPTLYYKGSRKPNTGDAVVDLLDPVGSSLELGAFVKYSFRGIGGQANQFDIGLSAGQDLLSGHGGFRAQLLAGHSWRWRSGMFVRAGIGVSFADANYTQSSFGITPRGSLATGLPTYLPGAGLDDVSASALLNIPISGRWSLFGTMAYSRLVASAADSPFVRGRGAADQGFGGLSLAYRF
jgi:MipA family protein